MLFTTHSTFFSFLFFLSLRRCFVKTPIGGFRSMLFWSGGNYLTRFQSPSLTGNLRTSGRSHLACVSLLSILVFLVSPVAKSRSVLCTSCDRSMHTHGHALAGKRIEKSFDCRCCRNFCIYFLNYLVRYSFAIHHFTVGESQVRVKTDLFIALSVSYSVILSASVGWCGSLFYQRRAVFQISQCGKQNFITVSYHVRWNLEHFVAEADV